MEATKSDLDSPWPHDGKTDKAGLFIHDYLISPYPSDKPHWYLKVSKDGFEPVVIDIKLMPQPAKSKDGPIPLPVTVELKPKAEAVR